MRLVLFSGTHSRHLFVNREVLKHFDEVLVIVMQREELTPCPPENISSHDRELFIKHFANRYKVESSVYGKLCVDEVFGKCETISITPEQLNTQDIANKIYKFKSDFCFIFGVDLILDPVINSLPRDKVNLHLGLSPWFKGGATLFWPFYLLQPQYCGATFHQITKQADAGEIIHQCVPNLEIGDTIHDVAAKCVIKSVEDLSLLFNHYKIKKCFSGRIQQASGRNWRGVDFHASQLRVIYDLFNDDIVDAYLNGMLEKGRPNLFTCLE